MLGIISFLAIFSFLAIITSSESILNNSDKNSFKNNFLEFDEEKLNYLWGPYRPGQYVGFKAKVPFSISMGLIWHSSNTINGLSQIRHDCNTGDNMKGYGWEKYDPRLGGQQIIHDVTNKIDITTNFIKIPNQGWALRVRGNPIINNNDNNKIKTTIAFYLHVPSSNGFLKLLGITKKSLSKSTNLLKNDISFIAKTDNLPLFNVNITDNDYNNHKRLNKSPKPKDYRVSNLHDTQRWHIFSSVIDDNTLADEGKIYQSIVAESMKYLQTQITDNQLLRSIPPYSYFTINDVLNEDGNFYLIQKTYVGSFEFDILLNYDLPNQDENDKNNKLLITSKTIDEKFPEILEKIDSDFATIFHPQKPFDKPEYYKFSQNLLSNLVGGIGYFYGSALVDRSSNSEVSDDGFEFLDDAKSVAESGKVKANEEGPYELFTSVPSRPFFPRGFYWDEGFHLLPIMEQDSTIALEIIKSWFELVDSNGWIAREQILGLDARRRVPPEFTTQFANYANPPTLMLALARIADILDAKDVENESNSEFYSKVIKTLVEMYPNLRIHYNWFRKTQRGEIREWGRGAHSSREGYRWRGRTKEHCLTSGLDDYPRANPPHVGELNVDLLSWIGVMTRAMKRISGHIIKQYEGKKLDLINENNNKINLDYILEMINEDGEMFEEIEKEIIYNLDDLHWSKKQKTYCDVTINDLTGESVFACHKGYVSILPFALELIPADSDHINYILDTIRNPEELWSKNGLRSLSKTDKYFGTGENYWRGPIWININYLVLEALKNYYTKIPSNNVELKDKIESTYRELRINVVKNVYNRWKETSFAWEQYDANTGSPKGVKHFLGWTSLVVMIMQMPERL